VYEKIPSHIGSNVLQATKSQEQFLKRKLRLLSNWLVENMNPVVTSYGMSLDVSVSSKSENNKNVQQMYNLTR
jgi:hypothetical protein